MASENKSKLTSLKELTSDQQCLKAGMDVVSTIDSNLTELKSKTDLGSLHTSADSEPFLLTVPDHSATSTNLERGSRGRGSSTLPSLGRTAGFRLSSLMESSEYVDMHIYDVIPGSKYEPPSLSTVTEHQHSEEYQPDCVPEHTTKTKKEKSSVSFRKKLKRGIRRLFRRKSASLEDLQHAKPLARNSQVHCDSSNFLQQHSSSPTSSDVHDQSPLAAATAISQDIKSAKYNQPSIIYVNKPTLAKGEFGKEHLSKVNLADHKLGIKKEDIYASRPTKSTFEQSKQKSKSLPRKQRQRPVITVLVNEKHVSQDQETLTGGIECHSTGDTLQLSALKLTNRMQETRSSLNSLNPPKLRSSTVLGPENLEHNKRLTALTGQREMTTQKSSMNKTKEELRKGYRHRPPPKPPLISAFTRKEKCLSDEWLYTSTSEVPYSSCSAQKRSERPTEKKTQTPIMGKLKSKEVEQRKQYRDIRLASPTKVQHGRYTVSQWDIRDDKHHGQDCLLENKLGTPNESYMPLIHKQVSEHQGPRSIYERLRY